MTFNPTPAQQNILDVVEQEPTTSIVVDARAGAAKTSTIVLAAQKIGPEFSPLAVAFNKKIAEELQSRLPSHFMCATLNSLGHRAWGARLGKRLILNADKTYAVAKNLVPQESDEEKEAFSIILTLVRKAKGSGLVPIGAPLSTKGPWADTAESWETFALDAGILDLPDDAIFWARKVLLKSIDLAFQGEIDFDDQIYMSVLFGGTYPKYHTVIIDEAQDLSPLNHRQIEKLCGTRAIIVGDPYQAIYGFRGADNNSITNLCDRLKFDFKVLPLSLSFRVPKSISARQTFHVPDFGSMDFLEEGTIEYWPKEEKDGPKSWSLSSIPQSGFVLCRNNAPLMQLAFAMIKTKRPVKILGRDIGASIANQLLKVTGKAEIPIAACWDKLEKWRQNELEKAGESELKVSVIMDKFEAMYVLLEAFDQGEGEKLGVRTNVRAADFIRDLFTDRADEFKTTFASIHRAKGLESEWIMMLNPELIPSRQALKAERNGNLGPMEQERNLKYVGETRSKGTLVFASIEDCAECGR